jgi:hypothetical protein
MKIRTLYKNERVTKKELKTATQFMLALLLNEKVLNKINLTIESREILPDPEDWANLYPFDNNKYRYRILLNNTICRKRQLINLAHELVHVKQFITGELGGTWKEYDKEFTDWNQKPVCESIIDYYDRPWEIEANGREYGLWRRYEMYLSKNKIKYS